MYWSDCLFYVNIIHRILFPSLETSLSKQYAFQKHDISQFLPFPFSFVSPPAPSFVSSSPFDSFIHLFFSSLDKNILPYTIQTQTSPSLPLPGNSDIYLFIALSLSHIQRRMHHAWNFQNFSSFFSRVSCLVACLLIDIHTNNKYSLPPFIYLSTRQTYQ